MTLRPGALLRVVLILPLDLQGALLLAYALLLSAVYLAPLTFTCPCIMDRRGLKPRPAVMGRRGAPMVGPSQSGLMTSKEDESPTCTPALLNFTVVLHPRRTCRRWMSG